jgi:hypothetical protein
MFGIATREMCFVVTLVTVSVFGAKATHAQGPMAPTDVRTADLLRQMEEMQRELAYLRQRDAQREAWESSVVEQLPQVGPSTSAVSYSLGTAESESGDPVPACDEVFSGSCHRCGCLGIRGCKCPPKEAPCIDCPRVSTLNPYFNVNIFGALKLDMLFSGPRPISPGTPYFLTSDSPRGLNQDTFDIHARQSTLAAAFTGPQIGGFQSGGLVMAVFYNDNVLADQYGFLPLQAYGDLRNENWRFAAGLQFDVFNPGSPTVLPFSALCGSGNSGNAFRGQLRLERFLNPSDTEQWTIQAALSEPIVSTIDPTFRISEDNGWPNLEARIALGLGAMGGAAAQRPFEFGVSGVVGQLRTTPPSPDDRVVADVWGLGTDVRWKMTDCFGMSAEFYTGQTLGTYSGGVLQTISQDTLEGVRSSGGWFETYLYWTPCLHSHMGYGVDDPIDGDVTRTTGIVRNETYFGNVIWDINPTLRVAFELTWRETSYRTLLDNEGPGFHTQFQLAF